jgi:protein-disulfide isomerase
MVALFCFVLVLPNFVFGVLESRLGSMPPRESDPVAEWQMAPVKTFDNRTDGGAFGDYARGPANAPIQIVEFADYQCPGCRRLYLAIEPLLRAYEGKYRLTFRNYPLDNQCNPHINHEFHRYSCAAVVFSRCAGEQGKFWEALDFLFTFDMLEGDLPLADVEKGIAEKGSSELSLDPAAILDCMKSGRYLDKIHADITAGDNADLTGTPSLWINGRLVRLTSPANIEKIFKYILAGK